MNACLKKYHTTTIKMVQFNLGNSPGPLVNAMPSMSREMSKPASSRARLTAPGYIAKWRSIKTKLYKYHITLVRLHRIERVNTSLCLMSSRMLAVKITASWNRHSYILFCLITTLDRIFLDELTIAAQVSSAEDSRARTLNSLASVLVVARHAIRAVTKKLHRGCTI